MGAVQYFTVFNISKLPVICLSLGHECRHQLSACHILDHDGCQVGETAGVYSLYFSKFPGAFTCFFRSQGREGTTCMLDQLKCMYSVNCTKAVWSQLEGG